jgi:hypothetical protein
MRRDSESTLIAETVIGPREDRPFRFKFIESNTERDPSILHEPEIDKSLPMEVFPLIEAIDIESPTISETLS